MSIPDLQLLATIKAEFLADKARAESLLNTMRKSVITSARNELMIVLRQRLADIRSTIGEQSDRIIILHTGEIQIKIHQMNDSNPFPFKENGPFFIDGHESPTVTQLVNGYLFHGEPEENVAELFQRTYGVELMLCPDDIDGNTVTFFVNL